MADIRWLDQEDLYVAQTIVDGVSYDNGGTHAEKDIQHYNGWNNGVNYYCYQSSGLWEIKGEATYVDPQTEKVYARPESRFLLMFKNKYSLGYFIPGRKYDISIKHLNDDVVPVVITMHTTYEYDPDNDEYTQFIYPSKDDYDIYGNLIPNSFTLPENLTYLQMDYVVPEGKAVDALQYLEIVSQDSRITEFKYGQNYTLVLAGGSGDGDIVCDYKDVTGSGTLVRSSLRYPEYKLNFKQSGTVFVEFYKKQSTSIEHIDIVNTKLDPETGHQTTYIEENFDARYKQSKRTVIAVTLDRKQLIVRVNFLPEPQYLSILELDIGQSLPTTSSLQTRYGVIGLEDSDTISLVTKNIKGLVEGETEKVDIPSSPVYFVYYSPDRYGVRFEKIGQSYYNTELIDNTVTGEYPVSIRNAKVNGNTSSTQHPNIYDKYDSKIKYRSGKVVIKNTREYSIRTSTDYGTIHRSLYKQLPTKKVRFSVESNNTYYYTFSGNVPSSPLQVYYFTSEGLQAYPQITTIAEVKDDDSHLISGEYEFEMPIGNTVISCTFISKYPDANTDLDFCHKLGLLYGDDGSTSLSGYLFRKDLAKTMYQISYKGNILAPTGWNPNLDGDFAYASTAMNTPSSRMYRYPTDTDWKDHRYIKVTTINSTTGAESTDDRDVLGPYTNPYYGIAKDAIGNSPEVPTDPKDPNDPIYFGNYRYLPYVSWTTWLGVMMGYSDNIFDPGAYASIEQICAVLFRYAKFRQLRVAYTSTVDINKYIDPTTQSEWSKNGSVTWVLGAGLLSVGDLPKDSQGKINLKGSLPVDKFAKMIANFYKMYL